MTDGKLINTKDFVIGIIAMFIIGIFICCLIDAFTDKSDDERISKMETELSDDTNIQAVLSGERKQAAIRKYGSANNITIQSLNNMSLDVICVSPVSGDSFHTIYLVEKMESPNE